MTNMQPGWFTDPSDNSKLRWWDGSAWSDNVSRSGAVWREALPVPPVTPVPAATTFPVWAWIALGVAALIAVLLVPSLVPVASVVALVTGIVALVKKTPTWLRLKSRNIALTVTASAAALLLVSGAVTANTTSAETQNDALVGAVPLVSDEDAGDSKPRPVPSQTSTPAPTRTPTPKPSPTPLTSTRDETVTEPITFERVTVEDGSLARGATQITTGGADGEKTLTYRVTLSDGKEVGRELVSEVVTREPVAEVTSLGTYDAPPPPPPPPAPVVEESGCDSNYAEACVPVSSDVDCAWGTGDGPAYFDGVALVVGSDVYGLDRDGDGYACEQ